MLRIKQKRRVSDNERKKGPNYTSEFKENAVKLVVEYGYTSVMK